MPHKHTEKCESFSFFMRKTPTMREFGNIILARCHHFVDTVSNRINNCYSFHFAYMRAHLWDEKRDEKCNWRSAYLYICTNYICVFSFVCSLACRIGGSLFSNKYLASSKAPFAARIMCVCECALWNEIKKTKKLGTQSKTTQIKAHSKRDVVLTRPTWLNRTSNQCATHTIIKNLRTTATCTHTHTRTDGWADR